jgi:hypothetical protein
MDAIWNDPVVFQTWVLYPRAGKGRLGVSKGSSLHRFLLVPGLRAPHSNLLVLSLFSQLNQLITRLQ